MRGKHACRRCRVFDLLEGDDVGTELFGVLAQARVVRLVARPATQAIGFSQMLEVPARNLQRLAWHLDAGRPRSASSQRHDKGGGNHDEQAMHARSATPGNPLRLRTGVAHGESAIAALW